MTWPQRPAAVVGVGDRGFVEPLTRRRLSEARQSSTAVVIARAQCSRTSSGADGFYGGETDNGGLPGRQRLAQLRVTARARSETRGRSGGPSLTTRARTGAAK